MRRVDLMLGWVSLAGGCGAIVAVAWTAQWVSPGALLGVVMLANAAVRLRLAHQSAASSGSRPPGADAALSTER